MRVLDQIVEQKPIVMHGVSLSIGTTSPVDMDYLKLLKDLSLRCKARWISDHLCWTGLAHQNTHDLLPVPYNEETLNHVVERIGIVQDVLGQRLYLENPSTYLEFTESDMTEWEFLTRMCKDSGCGLMLDVNNIYVSCFNHGWDIDSYLDHLPYEDVVQFHLAGHTHEGTHIIDTHSAPVVEEVWELYAKVLQRCGSRSCLLEWDEKIPSFSRVVEELEKARAVANRLEIS